LSARTSDGATWSGSGICEDRVAIVTGAGRGIGREHALLLAAEGAKVVVNDLGDSKQASGSPAGDVVAEIKAGAGTAMANEDDIADFRGADHLIAQTLEEFGRLDVVVNNAGIIRDRMLINMSDDEWESVLRVHLTGTFAVTRAAACHWREQSKHGENVDARVINTTSSSGIFGNPGQTNYGAAKAGIAGFTVIAALELARYGVTVNAIAPTALTRMTEDLAEIPGVEDRSILNPRWVAPLVTWLASRDSAEVTGRVFMVSGQEIAVAEGWHRGPTGVAIDDLSKVGDSVRDLLRASRPNAGVDGR